MAYSISTVHRKRNKRYAVIAVGNKASNCFHKRAYLGYNEHNTLAKDCFLTNSKQAAMLALTIQWDD